MNSTQTTCLALSISALCLGGILLAQTLSSATPAQAATVNWQGSATVVTAKIQQGEDGLYILSGDTLSVYRTNASLRKMELLGSQKFSFTGGK